MISFNKQVKNIAAKVLLGLFSVAIVFHILVISGILPNEIVWGGRISFKEELYIMESISILVNVLFLFIILIKSGNIRIQYNSKLINGMIWVMFLLFILNTIGNLLAKTSIETIIFTPVTFISAVLCFVLLSKEKA